MDVGEFVIKKILQDSHAPVLSSCGVRERNLPSDFLFGSFAARALTFRDYLCEHPLRLRVTALLSFVGFGLEIGLNFADTADRWVALLQRLGAPLLIVAFIAILEMVFSWRTERRAPQFSWRTRPELDAPPESLLGA